MKVTFIKKHQYKAFSFKKGQTVDIYKTDAEKLIIDKIAVPFTGRLSINKKNRVDNGTND